VHILCPSLYIMVHVADVINCGKLSTSKLLQLAHNFRGVHLQFYLHSTDDIICVNVEFNLLFH